MKIKMIFAIIFFAISLNTYSQYETSEFSPSNDFYANNYLNGPNAGRGNTGIASENGIWGMEYNPSSLTLSKKYQASIQYIYKNKVNAGYSSWSYKQSLPFSGSLGFAAAIGKMFNAGILYSNSRSYKFSIGTVTQTDEFGNIIRSFEGYNDYVYHSVTIPIVFHSGKFSAGVGINYTHYYSFTNIATTETLPDGFVDASSSMNSFNVQGGLQFRPSNRFTVGLTFTPGMKPNVTYDPAPQSITEPVQYYVNFPWRAGLGFEYATDNRNLIVSADYYYSNYGKPMYQDLSDVNIGLEGKLNEKLIIKGGFFTLITAYVPYYIDYTGTKKQLFFTVGGTYKIKNYEISASILDSHVSDSQVKNTIVNLSLAADF